MTQRVRTFWSAEHAYQSWCSWRAQKRVNNSAISSRANCGWKTYVKQRPSYCRVRRQNWVCRAKATQSNPVCMVVVSWTDSVWAISSINETKLCRIKKTFCRSPVSALLRAGNYWASGLLYWPDKERPQAILGLAAGRRALPWSECLSQSGGGSRTHCCICRCKLNYSAKQVIFFTPEFGQDWSKALQYIPAWISGIYCRFYKVCPAIQPQRRIYLSNNVIATLLPSDLIVKTG